MVDIPEPGTVLGRYRVEGELGRGGMAVVLRAHDLVLDRPVALKLLGSELLRADEFRARFDRESQLLSRVNSPHVVHIYDIGTFEDRPYIASQLVEGQNLLEFTRSRWPLDRDAIASIVRQVCDALEDAHSVGVVHRDIKPSNILVRESPRLQLFVCDFGIATDGLDHITRTGSTIGTWAYLAPERFRGVRADPRSDIYSVGCLLFGLLVGRPPFEGSDHEVSFAHLYADVPETGLEPRIAAVISTALEKDPESRFQTVADLKTATLEALQPGATRDERTPQLPGSTVPSVLISGPTGSQIARRRRPARILLFALLLVGLAAAALLALAVHSINTRNDRLAGAVSRESVHRPQPACTGAVPTCTSDFRLPTSPVPTPSS